MCFAHLLRRSRDDNEPPDEWEWTAAERARLVVPRPGYGMGIQGNARNYYDAANSLMPFVRSLMLTVARLLPLAHLARVHEADGWMQAAKRALRSRATASSCLPLVPCYWLH